MKEYTTKEMKALKANPYTFKVTKYKLYFTVEFKKAFWTAYQAGMTPRNILEDFGYDLSIFSQKQIDGIVQNIKRQALDINGFTEGENRSGRTRTGAVLSEDTPDVSPESMDRIWNEVKYLRQEVDFLKKILKADNSTRRKP